MSCLHIGGVERLQQCTPRAAPRIIAALLFLARLSGSPLVGATKLDAMPDDQNARTCQKFA